MKVIAVLNQKGGSGKTTIATHLARALQLDGADVLLVDSDPQGSARDWAAVREDQPLTVVGIDRPTIDRDVKNVARKVDFVVIDGAPQAADLAVSAIKAADFVLIPVQPSPYDIWAAQEVVEMVKIRQQLTEAPRAAFVIARAIVGTQLAADVQEALGGYGLPIFASRTYQRVLYANAAASGLSVLEADSSSAAADEIKAILSELEGFCP